MIHHHESFDKKLGQLITLKPFFISSFQVQNKLKLSVYNKFKTQREWIEKHKPVHRIYENRVWTFARLTKDQMTKNYDLPQQKRKSAKESGLQSPLQVIYAHEFLLTSSVDQLRLHQENKISKIIKKSDNLIRKNPLIIINIVLVRVYNIFEISVINLNFQLTWFLDIV